MDKEKILKLARLARIEMTPEEVEKMTKEFDSILGYVGEIKGKTGKISNSEKTKDHFSTRNVMRGDDTPHEGGIYSEELLNSSPAREKNYVKVKKIL